MSDELFAKKLLEKLLPPNEVKLLEDIWGESKSDDEKISKILGDINES